MTYKIEKKDYLSDKLFDKIKIIFYTFLILK